MLRTSSVEIEGREKCQGRYHFHLSFFLPLVLLAVGRCWHVHGIPRFGCSLRPFECCLVRSAGCPGYTSMMRAHVLIETSLQVDLVRHCSTLAVRLRVRASGLPNHVLPGSRRCYGRGSDRHLHQSSRRGSGPTSGKREEKRLGVLPLSLL